MDKKYELMFNDLQHPQFNNSSRISDCTHLMIMAGMNSHHELMLDGQTHHKKCQHFFFYGPRYSTKIGLMERQTS